MSALCYLNNLKVFQQSCKFIVLCFMKYYSIEKWKDILYQLVHIEKDAFVIPLIWFS